MILTYQDEKSLQDGLNLWEDYAPKVVKKGALYSIVNLPVLGDELVINGDFGTGLLPPFTDESLGSETVNVIANKLELVRIDVDNRGRANQLITLVSATVYKVDWYIEGVLQIQVGTPQNTSDNVLYNDNSLLTGVGSSFHTTIGNTGLGINSINNGTLSKLNYVSIREVLE